MAHLHSTTGSSGPSILICLNDLDKDGVKGASSFSIKMIVKENIIFRHLKNVIFYIRLGNEKN